jgi:SAM-dependent methyltransferase
MASSPFAGVPALSEGSSRYGWKAIPGSSHEILRRRLLAIPRESAVLDLGAGDGHLGSAVRGHVSHLTGVESDPAAASTPAAATYDRWITASLSPDLPVGRRFDVILCADILEHLSDPDHLLRAARQWIEPGGRLFVSIPNVANVTVRLAVLAGRFPYSDRGLLDRTHLRFFTRRSALRLVEECGFAVDGVTATAMPVELAWPLLGRLPLRPLVRALTVAAARLWPTLFGYQFVIEARAR